jgi:hypothetical protein
MVSKMSRNAGAVNHFMGPHGSSGAGGV